MISNFNINLILRRIILIFVDSFLILIAFLFSLWICSFNGIENLNYFIFTLPFTILTYFFTGQYKSLSRYVGSLEFYRIIIRNLFILIIQFILYRENIDSLFLKFLIINWIILSGLLGIIRFSFRDLIRRFYRKSFSRSNISQNTLIYGAGSAGAQLLSSLQLNNNYSICGFIDDNRLLEGREISGIQIYHPDYIDDLIKRYSIKFLLVAMPSVEKETLKNTIKRFTKHRIKILQVPSLEDIANGKEKIEYLREIKIEDLLKREAAPPNKNLIKSVVKNKTILVTGAGGSIGSELCRRIMKFNPNKVILVDNSEYNLYSIDLELRNYSSELKEKIFPILGDVTNMLFIENIFKNYTVDIIFHAAAYKHVPLLEINPLQAIKNNIISTKILCELVKKYNTNHMVLISTDKAVRPSSIMGATKRLAEIIVQGFAKEINSNDIKTKTSLENKSINQRSNFSIVRFGNVLGSSGSVVPRFQEQIKQGGPITLTHPNINRYFMSITEAAELVLQAAALEKNGDVLLLDMGAPIKIIDLAKNLILLNGLSIKDKNNNGDIEIINIGLRPGEKLYEELLINKNSKRTSHPLIFKGIEESPELETIKKRLEMLEINLDLGNKSKSIEILKSLVPEWVKPSY